LMLWAHSTANADVWLCSILRNLKKSESCCLFIFEKRHLNFRIVMIRPASQRHKERYRELCGWTPSPFRAVGGDVRSIRAVRSAQYPRRAHAHCSVCAAGACGCVWEARQGIRACVWVHRSLFGPTSDIIAPASDGLPTLVRPHARGRGHHHVMAWDAHACRARCVCIAPRLCPCNRARAHDQLAASA